MSDITKRNKQRSDDGNCHREIPRRTVCNHDSKWANSSQAAESKSEEEESPLRTYLSCTYDFDIDVVAPKTPKDLCDRQIHVHVTSEDGSTADIEEQICKIDVSNFALGMRSPVFRRMLSAESGFAESGRDDVVVHIPGDQLVGFEVMVRLLHLQSDDIIFHLSNIIWPKLLIQLLVICDRFRVMGLISPILKTFEKLTTTPPKLENQRPSRSNSNNSNAYGARYSSLDADDIVDVFDGEDLGLEMTDEEENTSRPRKSNDHYALFDTGKKKSRRHRKRFPGMTVDELIEIINLRVPHVESLQQLMKITAESLCRRFARLEFNSHGMVDEKFRLLPAKAVKMILEQNHLRSWCENDVFLAACQWVNNDCCRHLSEVADGIRFHCMDAWFLAEIVSRHTQVINTPHLFEYVVECLRVASTNPTIRKGLVCKFLDDKLKPRRTPGGGSFDGSSFNGYNGISHALYNTSGTTPRRLAEYDTFEVSFARQDCVNLEINSRVTSRYLVWRGITFAIDLVRKQSNERGGETVGVFLYCQGLVCTGKIMVRYGIQTVNHQHQLTCSDYKCMHLNFRRGNGSRDFFQCTWNTFLDTYFDESRLVLKVVFLAIE